MSGTFLGMPSLPVFGIGNLHEHEPFPKAAHRELGNAQLRANLGHATRTIRDKRLAVVSELPDWEELREAGRAIKESVMARLPELLEAVRGELHRPRRTIHWARDAGEANSIVARLIREQGADEVVKVKSMATQEIGLNEYLEEQGIAAFETDLAELIVQLDHDKPSHILVPAIHKNRSQVRDIFLREMEGVDPDLTNEPARLAAAARAHLRRKFLSAKVAVSGANFALADSGTLAVVESEGNGRMCLTLPETLITVMGVEKLLPGWEDLEVFMQLLPRSSTGERMNPYTSLWTGVTPDDGPQNVHLVLLDNGRSAALADEMGRSALHCIRCSACMNVCPVYERTGGHAYGSTYPGPIGAILPAADRDHGRGEQLAALRLVPVRRLLRRLPGEDQHPGHPGAPARRGRGQQTRQEKAAEPDGRRHEGGVLGLVLRKEPRPRRKGPAPGPACRRAGPENHQVAGHRRRLDPKPGHPRPARAVVPAMVEQRTPVPRSATWC